MAESHIGIVMCLQRFCALADLAAIAAGFAGVSGACAPDGRFQVGQIPGANVGRQLHTAAEHKPCFLGRIRCEMVVSGSSRVNPAQAVSGGVERPQILLFPAA